MTEFSDPLPPYCRIPNFLPESQRRQLFEWALALQDAFRPATISKERRLDPDRRIGLTSRKLGPMEPMLRQRLLDALPELMAETGTPGPPPTSLELELAAHGDGAFFSPHIDVPVGPGRQPLGAEPGEDRVLSAVYYFHAEPAAFSGGQLRLYAFGPVPADPDRRAHVDLDPVGNSLIAFPSWAPHEVRPVRVPSGEFHEFRFALNCWYCRSLAPKPA